MYLLNCCTKYLAPERQRHSIYVIWIENANKNELYNEEWRFLNFHRGTIMLFDSLTDSSMLEVLLSVKAIWKIFV